MYPDGSLTEIRIWQARKQRAFPTGVKYAFYFIGPRRERDVIVGYDNHHGEGHHRHAGAIEAAVTTPSATALVQRFRREVARHLMERGIRMKGQP